MAYRCLEYPALRLISCLAGWVIGALLVVSLSGCQVGTAGEEDPPEVRDDRLELTLFASDPDIMTPIGIAVDERDRIFVLESHTHVEPDDYEGPDGDRVKIFQDSDGDGHPEDVSIFAEGLDDGMNIAFSPDGTLYLVSSQEVWALYDRDDDGQSEAREKVLDMMVRPDDVYDHAGLMGVTFSHDGWMYISRGNTGGQDWKMVGSDGSSVSGYGDGGNIVRARPDGSELEEVATGFWNPFDLRFDTKGRLLVSDNDPDSRGPNRLVHVIPGGDYGYESLYGGSGIHPYLAWNGELPGTLPYAAPLGEAPSGMLVADRTGMPVGYQGDVLCTIWEESSIARVKLSPAGASVTGTSEVIVQGGPQFRPVAMAADSRGHVYITDWVVRQYPNHQRGRIWRLSTTEGTATMTPREAFAEPQPNPAGAVLDTLYAADGPEDFTRLNEALVSGDPFVRTAAITTLARPVFHDQVVQATRDDNPDVRLGALLALHRSGFEAADPIVRRLLEDSDPRVRRMALIWAGKEMMTGLRSDIAKAITVGSVSPDLFETYLATVRHLQPEFIEAYRNRAAEDADELPRELPSGFIASIVADAALPAVVRATALPNLDDPTEHVDLLVDLAWQGGHQLLRLEAIRSLADAGGVESAKALMRIASNDANPASVRAEAVLALSHQSADVAEEVVPLLDASDSAVRVEAARYLRTQSLSDAARQTVARTLESIRDEPGHEALRQQLVFIVSSSGDRSQRPDTDEAWQDALATGGDPQAGRRVFFAPQSQCSVCHTVGNRGGNFGPDLTNAGQSKNRRQLIHSILRPSDNIAPGWQRWFVETTDGEMHYGRQINVGYDDVEIDMQGRGTVEFDNVASYGMAEGSLMPDGLEAQLTVDDFRNLIAFLDDERVR